MPVSFKGRQMATETNEVPLGATPIRRSAWRLEPLFGHKGELTEHGLY
jgi:hypothetical protein